MLGRPFRPFRRAICWRLFANHLFQGSDFPEQIDEQRLNLRTVRIEEIEWRRHIRKEPHRVERGRRKIQLGQHFCPCYDLYTCWTGRDIIVGARF